MGCDIHAWAERRTGDRWETIELAPEPFWGRDYNVFAFLADVRNHAGIKPIAPPRGLPGGFTGWIDEDGGHSASWLMLSELEGFDYDQETEDRTAYVEESEGWASYDGDNLLPAGYGVRTTYRALLGDWFFAEVERLKAAGAERISFWFDN